MSSKNKDKKNKKTKKGKEPNTLDNVGSKMKNLFKKKKKNSTSFKEEKTARRHQQREKSKKLLSMSEDAQNEQANQIFANLAKNGKMEIDDMASAMEEWGMDIKDDNLDVIMDACGEEMDQAQVAQVMKTYLKVFGEFSKSENEEGIVDVESTGEMMRASGIKVSSGKMGILRKILGRDKKMNKMDFNDFSASVMQLNNVQLAAEKGKLVFDLEEFHATLRALNVRLDPTTAEVAFDMISSRYDLNNLDMDTIIDIVENTIDDMDAIEVEAQRIKDERRAKLKEEGIDREKRLKPIPIFSAEKLQELEEMRDNPEAKKIFNQDGLYEDPDFPCEVSSLFPKDEKRAKNITWVRPGDMEGVTAPALVEDGIDEGDVCQGALGDCWFLSALSTVAQAGNEAIMCLFLHYSPENGFAQCRFFKNGEWHIVTIDDRIPYRRNKIAFAHCRDINEMWVPLIEKAYAKLHGSYEALESGVISNGLVDLTGESSESLTVIPDDSYWEILKFSVEQKFFLGCACADNNAGVEEDNGLGILANHAYGVLNALEVKGKKLVRCRNPWGKHEWKGRWADFTKEWKRHKEIKQILDPVFIEDGTFWMTYDDWAKTFNRLYVLRTYSANSSWKVHCVIDEFKGETAGGCANYSTFSNNIQYLVIPEQTCEAFISIRQPCLRLAGNPDGKYTPVGVSIFEKTIHDKTREMKLSDPIFKSSYPTRRENSFDYFFEEGKQYVLVPHTFYDKEEFKFCFTLYTQYGCVFEQLTEEASVPSVSGEFTAETAGGCPNNASWTSNPQYAINFGQTGTYEIVFEQINDKPTHIAFYMWANNTDTRNFEKRENQIFKSDIINSGQVTGIVEVEEGLTYTIMPCSFDPGHKFPFKLSVIGEADIRPVTEVESTSLHGEWKSGSCGGCQNHDSWKENPTFPLHIDEDGKEISITLSVKEKLPIGFYIMTPDLSDTVHRVKFANATEITTLATLDRGEYVILAATFNPNIKSKFEITIR